MMSDNHQQLRMLHEYADTLRDFSEVLDELAAQVEQIKEDQSAFFKSVNQRLNAIEEKQKRG